MEYKKIHNLLTGHVRAAWRCMPSSHSGYRISASRATAAQNSSAICFDWKFNLVGLLLAWKSFDLWSLSFCEQGESISSVGDANLFFISKSWCGDGFLNIDLCKLLPLLDSIAFFWCNGWNWLAMLISLLNSTDPRSTHYLIFVALIH